ncbi:GIY-YIG nuclease family protein [Chryseobacterium sp. WX]|uniref:GIY-YIG nuclease family protein n=1 Tax=Chryseobacterium sp. WX TaxID=3031803 RepID=UPI002409418F|nr:GIY-YIG nuclease family protein [Chryseobacterium sp. WX]WFB66915.1 GIY-YIG nuclease family protein [Chryseobacterium sp. WX]
MKNALKKQLRERAKDHTTTMGVLAVTNISNGKKYVQGSLNLEALVNKMKFLLNGGLFTHPQLQKEWTELGNDSFTFEFVVIVPDQNNEFINYRKEVQKAEQSYISGLITELY